MIATNGISQIFYNNMFITILGELHNVDASHSTHFDIEITQPCNNICHSRHHQPLLEGYVINPQEYVQKTMNTEKTLLLLEINESLKEETVPSYNLEAFRLFANADPPNIVSIF
jgi:hypothetical protein